MGGSTDNGPTVFFLPFFPFLRNGDSFSVSGRDRYGNVFLYTVFMNGKRLLPTPTARILHRDSTCAILPGLSSAHIPPNSRFSYLLSCLMGVNPGLSPSPSLFRQTFSLRGSWARAELWTVGGDGTQGLFCPCSSWAQSLVNAGVILRFTQRCSGTESWRLKNNN